jgi:hypothetical protein
MRSLGSMTGWVGFALRTKKFNVLPGRPAANGTRRPRDSRRLAIRSRLTIQSSSARSAEADAAWCRLVPQQYLLAQQMAVQCCKSLYYFCSAMLAGGCGRRTKDEDKAMEGKVVGYLMELGRGSDKEDRERGEKEPGRQREHGC